MGAVESQLVLVVEQENTLRTGLEAGLRREGFAVRALDDGAQALAQLDDIGPDLVLLNLNGGRPSGIDLCREIRSRSRVPIILASSNASEMDIVVGLEVGADDYVSKPYRYHELVARMRAALRRAPVPEPSSPHSVMEVGEVRLDRERHDVSVNGVHLDLALKEFELLAMLLGHAGRVLSREVLISAVWGTGYAGAGKTLDVHVKRLRAKLEQPFGSPRRIMTIRGLGYRYDAP